MAVQLLALLLAAGRVPLSARFPQPIERQATAEMAAVQVIAAALLFPSLFGDFKRWIFVVASVWPMLRIAALLGGESNFHIYATAAYVTCWLTTLALWRRVLRTDQWQMIALSLAALWTLGGPILLYLHAEFGGGTGLWPGETSNLVWGAAGGPVWGALSRLWGNSLLVSDLPMIALLACGFLANAIRISTSPRPIDKLSP
jgi:hypothetical protein